MFPCFIGVDWGLVAEHVSMDNAYDRFQDPTAPEVQQQGWWQTLVSKFAHNKQDERTGSRPQTPGTVTPRGHSAGVDLPFALCATCPGILTHHVAVVFSR